jgi:methylglyoxal synthase
MNNDNLNIVKRIAVVAEDARKNELIEWSFDNRQVLSRHNIIAAGYTADVLEGTLNAPVHKLMTGRLGGYQQLGTMIAEGKVDVIIFLWDGNSAPMCDADLKSLLQIAEDQQIVIAANKRTAEVILSSSFLNNPLLLQAEPGNWQQKQAV